jgi:hypothetical protein
VDGHTHDMMTPEENMQPTIFLLVISPSPEKSMTHLTYMENAK